FLAGFIGTMNLIEGMVKGGLFTRGALSMPMNIAEGPVTLAVRPEALGLAVESPLPERAPRIHRVTDYGTHAIVDIDFPDGIRLKSMVPDGRLYKTGQPVGLLPSAVAAYRDNSVVYRNH